MDKTTLIALLGTITAEVCITFIAVVAIFNGCNGTIIPATIATLAGLGGYQIKHQDNKPKS